MTKHCEKWKSLSHVWLFETPETIQSMEFSGQNTGVGSLSHLQGIFPTQGSNPGLPHCMWIPCQLSHKGNPRILEWIAYPFSHGSSWSRNRTRVSCLAGRFFIFGNSLRWSLHFFLSSWITANNIFWLDLTCSHKTCFPWAVIEEYALVFMRF